MSSLTSRRASRLVLISALLAGTVLGGYGIGERAVAQTGAETATQAKPGAIQPSTPTQPLADFVGLVRQVKPAVVSITTKMRPEREMQPQLPFPFPFALPQQNAPRVVEARGSGFIIDPDGTIVTNNHVVKNAQSVSVTLDDGTVLPARIIGRDPRTDIAVLRVKAGRRLPFINLGDSSAVEPGEWVVAVGNPFGLGGTVTAGIVSARGRDIGEGPYDSFIQIDAPINQGNSGGPLFTQDGKVVGVNTAILSPSGGSIGIGFAIPSNTVKTVVAQLEKTGHVTRGYLGVAAQVVTPAMASALNLPKDLSPDKEGALVASVEQDGPAAKAGVQPGDVIQSVGGKPVGNPHDLAIDVADIAPGTQVQVVLLRDGKPRTLSVTIGTQPGNQVAAGGQGQGNPSIGVTLAVLTPELRQQLGLPGQLRGAVISEVAPGSAAETAGLQSGDVIVGVGDQPVASPREAASAIRGALRDGHSVALRIVRDGQQAFVAVSPDAGAGSSSGDEQDQGTDQDQDPGQQD